MYLQDLIAWIDRMKPNNRFSNEEKTAWINEIEGRIQQEGFLQPPEIVYEWETDKDTELLLSVPHDSVYRHWLQAQLSYANEEFNIYQNETEQFNASWRSFLLWICSAIRPAYKDRVWIPKVYPVVKGETVTVSFFDLPCEREDIASATISVWQKGVAVLEYGAEALTGEESLSATIPQADSLKLTPGAAKVTMVVTDKAGNRYEHYPYSRLNVIDSKYRREMT